MSKDEKVVIWQETAGASTFTSQEHMVNIFVEEFGFPNYVRENLIVEKDDEGNETYEIPEEYLDVCHQFWDRLGFIDSAVSDDKSRKLLARNLTIISCYFDRNRAKQHMVLGLDVSNLALPAMVRLFIDGYQLTLDNPQKFVESIGDFYRRHSEHFKKLQELIGIDLEAQATVEFCEYVKKKCAEDR